MNEEKSIHDGGQLPMEDVTLQNDTGADLNFSGRLHAQHSFFDEESSILTQQRLYVTNDGRQAYSIVATDGKNKERRAYLIKVEGALCKINNGLFDVTVKAEDLMMVVKGLCGIDDASRTRDFFDQVKDVFRPAVNQ